MVDPRPSSNPTADPNGCPELEGYQLLERVGRDGPAELVSAWATRGPLVGREVWIKRFAIHAHEPELSSLVLALAPVAWLRHPSVVAVHDIGSLRGLALVLEAVPSRPLASLLAHGPLPAPLAVRVAHDVVSALAAAHALVAPDGVAVPLVHGRFDARSVRVGNDGVARVEGFDAARIHAVKNPASAPYTPGDDVRAAAGWIVELVTGQRPRTRSEVERAWTARGLSAATATLLAVAPFEPGSIAAEALARSLATEPMGERFELAAAVLVAGAARTSTRPSAPPSPTQPPPAYRAAAWEAPREPAARGTVDRWLEQARERLRRGE